MDQRTDNRGKDGSFGLEQIVSALETGIILADRNGQIVAMDETARRLFNGDAQTLALPVDGELPAISARLRALTLMVNGERRTFCLVQETADQKEPGHDLAAAIEAVMSDTSWLTRTFVEKIKAWRQTRLPTPRASDLDILTDRERDILALICEGRSDVEMGRILNLSQNTVRNHVASLYRKIDVNRRSAAIIWARERGLTSQDVLAVRSHARVRQRLHVRVESAGDTSLDNNR